MAGPLMSWQCWIVAYFACLHAVHVVNDINTPQPMPFPCCALEVFPLAETTGLFSHFDSYPSYLRMISYHSDFSLPLVTSCSNVSAWTMPTPPASYVPIWERVLLLRIVIWT